MIETRFFCGSDGSLHMVQRGHAGAGEKGHDLICAGASTLAFTLGGAVEAMYYQQLLRRCPRIILEEGCAEIIALPKPESTDAARMVFWTIQTGIAALAENFPENIRLAETLRV